MRGQPDPDFATLTAWWSARLEHSPDLQLARQAPCRRSGDVLDAWSDGLELDNSFLVVSDQLAYRDVDDEAEFLFAIFRFFIFHDI